MGFGVNVFMKNLFIYFSDNNTLKGEKHISFKRKGNHFFFPSIFTRIHLHLFIL